MNTEEQTKTITGELTGDLIMYVDGFGLELVVRTLANIAHRKAANIRPASPSTAGLWGTAGGALNVAANKCVKLQDLYHPEKR